VTSYAVDEGDKTLVRIWGTGRGQRAAVVSKLPDDARTEEQLNLAQALSSLSDALWRCYTHPASAADSIEENSEGWHRQKTREAFAEVIPAISNPNLPDENGLLMVTYDPVEEGAHRVGRALHAVNTGELVEKVSADVAAELQAVESAERGDLSRRAAQAVLLSRAGASPVQVAAADSILKENPLAREHLFLDLDPTAASVAAAQWLKAAADVVAEVSGMPATQVLVAADDLEALPYETPNEVIELFDFSTSAYRVVVEMVSDAMLVAEGFVSDLGALLIQHDSGENDEDDGDEPTPIRLTLLDPQRPARDLLEDLLTGIYGCHLLYTEYIDTDENEGAVDAQFISAVRAEVERNSARLM
jgi:hypothetical protein